MTPSRSINRRASGKYNYPVIHLRVESQRIYINTELTSTLKSLLSNHVSRRSQ